MIELSDGIVVEAVYPTSGPNPIVFIPEPGIPVDSTIYFGPVSPSGDGGSAGPAGTLITQSTPAATWTLPVPPSFTRRPSVQVFLANGELIVADVVSTLTTVSVSFASPRAGFVILT